MSKIVIVLEKYSDWLDAYSLIVDYPDHDIVCHFWESERTDEISVESLFRQITTSRQKFTLHGYTSKEYFLDELPELIIKSLSAGDILAMPFIRYIQLWRWLKKVPSGVKSVHLSEGLPETFGHLGYRIGFRGKRLKTWLTLPYAKFYSLMNKADVCYFPSFPIFNNPFAKVTRKNHRPPLVTSKQVILDKLLSNTKRPLLIGGYGYDVEKMAKVLGYSQYIATSKNIEIIIDGELFPLPERISAEEVLLSGHVSKIIGYTSNVMVWAYLLYPEIPVVCYETKELNRFAGPLYSKFVARSLKRFSIKVHPEDPRMLVN